MENREIKFRVWDIFHKNMMYSGIDFDVINFTDGIIEWDWKWECYAQSLEIGKGKSVLMQFTGLFDKNGKEIYEKDIITYKKHIDVINFNKLEFKDSYLQGTSYGYHFRELLTGDIEIIGNIYENPELLKKGDINEMKIYYQKK